MGDNGICRGPWSAAYQPAASLFGLIIEPSWYIVIEIPSVISRIIDNYSPDVYIFGGPSLCGCMLCSMTPAAMIAAEWRPVGRMRSDGPNQFSITIRSLSWKQKSAKMHDGALRLFFRQIIICSYIRNPIKAHTFGCPWPLIYRGSSNSCGNSLVGSDVLI